MATTEYELGKREQISWGEESTYGTAVTPTDIVGYNATITPNFDQGWTEILSAGADTLERAGMEVGPKSLPFTLRFQVTNWKFLKYLYTSVVDAGADPYTHTYSVGATLNSFTLEWGKRRSTNRVITLKGCTVLNGRIEFRKAPPGGGQEAYVIATLECQAQDYDLGTTLTSLSLSETRFAWRHAKFTLNSTEITEINSGSLVIDNGVNPEQDSRYANATLDRNIGEPIMTTIRHLGQVNMNVKDTTWDSEWDSATAVGGTNKLEFIENDTNNKVVFTFTDIYPGGAGFAPTNIEGVNNVDMPFEIIGISPVVTDETATH